MSANLQFQAQAFRDPPFARLYVETGPLLTGSFASVPSSYPAM